MLLRVVLDRALALLIIVFLHASHVGRRLEGMQKIELLLIERHSTHSPEDWWCGPGLSLSIHVRGGLIVWWAHLLSVPVLRS